MALNMARAGTQLVVWNRSPDRCEPLRAAGASVAPSVAEVFAQTGIVILMLVDEAATASSRRVDSERFVDDCGILKLGTVYRSSHPMRG